MTGGKVRCSAKIPMISDDALPKGANMCICLCSLSATDDVLFHWPLLANVDSYDYTIT